LLSIQANTRPALLISPLNLSDGNFPYIETAKSSKKNQSKIPATWGGATLSQETKNVEGIDMTVYSLTGGAWILHKKVKLSANSIEIVGEDAYRGHLKGQTKVEDPENGITLTAGKGIYDKAQETVTLEGRRDIIYDNLFFLRITEIKERQHNEKVEDKTSTEEEPKFYSDPLAVITFYNNTNRKTNRSAW